MVPIEYTPAEVRKGAVLLVSGETLTVDLVTFRPGRGLEFFTRRPDGYCGPVIAPHPDNTVPVVYMPPVSEDDLDFIRRVTPDFPWAEER